MKGWTGEKAVRQLLICMIVVTGVAVFADGSPVKITQSTLDDMGPVWHPGSDTIAYVKENTDGKWHIGAVQASGANERFLGTGPGGGYYGYAFSLSWVGSTSEIMTHERVSYHEHLAFDTSQSPFNRVISNGSDAANTRKLVVPAGGGGNMIRVSRDGLTVLWRHSANTGTASIRTAPYASLIGQNTNAVGTVVLTGSSSYGVRGAALTPNGLQYVISLPSGALGGWDMFLDNSDGTGGLTQLTTTGQTSGLDNYVSDISPNGNEILFHRGIEGTTAFDIFKIGIDGGNLVQLTNTPGIEDSGGTWSPDGTQ